MLKKKFSKFLLILKIVPRLGILDILNVLIFKTGVKLGFHKVCKLVAVTPKGTFFILEDAKIVNAEVVENWETEGIYLVIICSRFETNLQIGFIIN